MKKIFVAVATIVAASTLVASPASALTKEDAGTIVCQIPTAGDAYYMEQFGLDAVSIEQVSGGVDSSFNEPYPFVAVDNENNTLYLLSSLYIYSTDLLTNSDATEIGSSTALGDTFAPVGLAVDDLTGSVYAATFDSVSGDYNIFKFNVPDNIFEAHLTVSSSDLTDGGNLAFYDGHIYVFDKGSGQIVVFDATSGAQTGLIEAAPDNYASTNINAAIHVTPNGNIFFYSETTVGSDYGINFYSLATSSWETTVDANNIVSGRPWGASFQACTWWGSPEVEKTPELPNTGVDALGISLVAGTFLAAGGVLRMIRRRAAN